MAHITLGYVLLFVATTSALPHQFFVDQGGNRLDPDFDFGGNFFDVFFGGPEPSAAPIMAPAASPVTNMPITGAPVTNAPVTNAPATNSPVTNAPATNAPVTNAPATNAPVTSAPVTNAPVTHAPVTKAPSTNAPVTLAPFTDAPITSPPVTAYPVTIAPFTEAPVTVAPVTRHPTTASPVTYSPEATVPATTAPIAKAPITPSPVTSAPVTASPVTSAPITSAPITPSPTTLAPITPAPVTPAPVTPAPVTPAPVTPAPVTPAPVTPAPVTSAPVTPAPVTSAPVTSAPVTLAPVTSAPVTSAPVMQTPPEDPPMLLSSTHRLQWGSVADGCDYTTPVAFISCGDGGWLTIISNENSECEELSLDYSKCVSLDNNLEDSFVNFKCTGTTSEHLTASARVFESEATNCDKLYSQVQDRAQTTTVVGGNAVTFGTLGRYCLNNDGEMALKNRYSCIEGVQGEDGDVLFCAVGDMCTDQKTCGSICFGTPSCDVNVGPFIVSNPDTTEHCAEVENNIRIPEDHVMSPSGLASYYYVEWTFSGLGFLCDWAVPDVTFTCQDGGRIQLDSDDSPFCSVSDDSITCTNPEPSSEEQRLSYTMGIWCHGITSEQLVLSGISPISNDPDSRCEPSGIAVQGIKIARACGGFGSSDFEFVTDQEFCNNPEQLHSGSGLCYAGSACSRNSGGCTPVVPAVAVETNTDSVRNCVYAV